MGDLCMNAAATDVHATTSLSVRRPAVAVQENNQMRLVQYISAPLCLELVHGTRVCAVRVDNAADMKHKVGCVQCQLWDLCV